MLGHCFTPYQRLWLYNGAPSGAFYDTLGIRRMYSRHKPPASSRGSSRNTRSSSNLDYIVPRKRTCEMVSFFYQGIKKLGSSRNTRSSSNLDYIVPRIRTCESRSFFYQGIKNWNELPRHIKKIKGKESFKINVKKHLMEK